MEQPRAEGKPDPKRELLTTESIDAVLTEMNGIEGKSGQDEIFSALARGQEILDTVETRKKIGDVITDKEKKDIGELEHVMGQLKKILSASH